MYLTVLRPDFEVVKEGRILDLVSGYRGLKSGRENSQYRVQKTRANS
jgi:hypothetical protein